jgi:PAS domain S-box-containing protein
MTDNNASGPDTPNLATRLVTASGDAIVVADREGKILLWNRGAETMFGYPAAEAVGNSLDLIIPENLRARHEAGFRQTMRTGATRYADDVLAVPGLRRDGSRISLVFRVTLLSGPAGYPEAIAAIIRDVTDRWRADKALQRELAHLRGLVTRDSTPYI